MPRILIVDDDPGIRRLYREVLQAEGHDVEDAGSRTVALATLDRLAGGVDAIVMDIGLPDADGADLAREIAERWGTRPTLYITGFGDEFVPLWDAPGRWQILQKPVPIPQFMKSLHWLLGLSDAAGWDAGDEPPRVRRSED